MAQFQVPRITLTFSGPTSAQQHVRLSCGSPTLFYGVAIGIVVLLGWIFPLGSSLWQDEFGTFWIAKGTFAEMVSRAFLSMQSPLYQVLPWLFMKIAPSEALIRLPSTFAVGLATYMMFCI